MSVQKIVYASKSYIKSIGGITNCYPMGKGQGLFCSNKCDKARSQAKTDGWNFTRLVGVGHDYNLNGDIYVISRIC